MTNENTIGKSGVPSRPTHSIHDSSKIQAFMDCPRGYFYSEVLGWKPERANIHLTFGSAWHAALEHLAIHGHTPEAVAGAYRAFLAIYERDFDPMIDENPGKTPEGALNALVGYAKQYHRDRPEDVLFTEVAGTVPISESRVIHVKLDTIALQPPWHELAGYIHSREHKTTGKKTSTWMEKWLYLFQVGTYSHALYAFAADTHKVDGVTINGSIFRKNDFEHIRIPIHYSKDMLLQWLWEANHWIDQIEMNFAYLAESSPSDRVMVAFPRNTASCSKYGCRYPGLCSVRANPLQVCHQVPPGYKQEFWDPRKKEETAKKIVRLPQTEATASIHK